MDPVTGAALISAGGSLLGGVLGNNSAKKAAKAANEFSERMANTQHQREVVDLKAAGLNPMLSVMGGNGAAAPSGQIANVSKDLLSPALSSARSAMENKQAVENAKMQNYVLATQADKNTADANLSSALGRKAQSETDVIQANTPEREAKGAVWDSINKILHPAKELFDGSFSAKSNAGKPTVRVTPHKYQNNEILPPPSYK